MPGEQEITRTASRWPAGLNLRGTLRGHSSWIGRISWSPDGRWLASGSDDKSVNIWDADSGEVSRQLRGHEDTVFSVTWSPDRRMLASSSDDETIILWNVEDGRLLRTLRGHTSGVVTTAWSADSLVLLSGGGDKAIRLWEAATGKTLKVLEGHDGWIRQLSLSPNGKILASGSYDRKIGLWNLPTGMIISFLEGHADRVHSVVWAPSGEVLASASKDATIRIWSPDGTCLRVLEGHTGAIYDLSFSSDGLFLASKSLDSTVRIWKCSDWSLVSVLHEKSVATDFGGLSFHPTASILATLGELDTVIRVWHFDTAVLSRSEAPQAETYISAKVVLVGESNMGKSCLALRLAEDRYEEMNTTHGLRFWELKPEQLSPDAGTPTGEHRDVILWDLGGQDEYRLIHQMFLHDTTLALFIFDPTRGKSVFEEIEAWNTRLEKQLRGRRAVKLLVGTKLDEPTAVVDTDAIERLIRECNFVDYFPTSAKLGIGIQELGKAISQAIDWQMLAKVSRPEVFQRVREEIDRARGDHQIVISVAELSAKLAKSKGEEVSPDDIDTVVTQLALQGIVATTSLANGERVLILRVEEIERYACSIILAARENARGFAAVEERWVSSNRTAFPRIGETTRLSWYNERIVLECVIQLLIEHDICLRHEGLLVFPSLFPDRASRDESDLPHVISVHYDFAGAIENIYASLVVRLSLSGHFGRYRLWKNSAEWEMISGAVCGLRKVPYTRGAAHIDVYFAEEIDPRQRDLFYVFIEDHLRSLGVDIKEKIQTVCICGQKFQQDAISARLAIGKYEITCPVCERITSIIEGPSKVRSQDAGMERILIALKTVIEKTHTNHIAKATAEIRAQVHEAATNRILHLSDIHMNADSDPDTMSSQLISDLRSKRGLDFDRLDYLVITGDLTSYAAPEEFEKAYRFVSKVLDNFGISSARCIIVPGNHDISWDENVYDWVPKRKLRQRLEEGTYVEQGDVVLVRNEKLYPRRFENFRTRFYKFLILEEYSSRYEEQAVSFLFEDSRIQLLALNSCWEIDEFFEKRSGISSKALTYGLDIAEKQLEKARAANRIAPDAQVLRIAIWHHPVTGSEAMADDAFLERLRQANFRFCLHGHVHEDRAELIGYTDPARHMRVAGAGSFGAWVTERPPSTPRLYNVIEIKKDLTEIKVHTRCLRKDKGAWDAWAVWPGDSPEERLSYYRVPISDLFEKAH